MNRKKVDSQRERRILIAMIVSTKFLRDASKVVDLDLISSEHYRLIAEWCLEYFAEYSKAPGDHIEQLYHAWCEDNEDSDLTDSVKDFLDGLGEEYSKAPELNVPYLLDELRAFMTKRQLVSLKENLEYSLSQGQVGEAEKSLTEYRRIEIGQGTGFDPMLDRGALNRAFAEKADPLITFEGDAGAFFNPFLTRDALVGIQAPEKTGKTFWCVEFVMRALRQRRRVALFEVGDLSESQIMLRLGVRWSGRPMYRWQTRRPIILPRKVVPDDAEDAGYSVLSTRKRIRRIMTKGAVLRGVERFRRASGMVEGSSYVRTAIFPSHSINVAGISNVLDQWAQDHDFIADVIVIDYADILDTETISKTTKKEARNAINDTWAALRRLSQQRHALVITPTQANAASYGIAPDTLQTKSNFSEDKRKYAHVTAMLGLNQSSIEKEVNGMRLNWIVAREAPFNEARPLMIGTCFALGRALCAAHLSSGIQGSGDNG